jgi:TetR/AcrR family transcriptional regulator, transcriptional repressor for nem operon
MARTKAFNEANVLEKAQKLFWQKGYEATSMDDLVNELGISRSSLYNTFGDKENLYCKTLSAYCNANAHTLVKEAAVTKEPLKFIEKIFDSTLNDVKVKSDIKGCYAVNAVVELIGQNKNVDAILTANATVFENMLQTLISAGQKDGSIQSRKSSKQLAKFLYTTICGIKVNAKANEPYKNLREVANVALEALQY